MALEALRACRRAIHAGLRCDAAGVPQATLCAMPQAFAAPVGGRREARRRGLGHRAEHGPHSNLAEHLVECLNVVCGRFARAGDRVPNPGVLGPRWPRRAQVIAPRRGVGRPVCAGVGGFGPIFGERMSGALPDEILSEGRGRVRGLIVDGGNPVNRACQSSRKTAAAFARSICSSRSSRS